MNDFWEALIKGLTFEKSESAGLWWKIPLFFFFIMAFLTLF